MKSHPTVDLWVFGGHAWKLERLGGDGSHGEGCARRGGGHDKRCDSLFRWVACKFQERRQKGGRGGCGGETIRKRENLLVKGKTLQVNRWKNYITCYLFETFAVNYGREYERNMYCKSSEVSCFHIIIRLFLKNVKNCQNCFYNDGSRFKYMVYFFYGRIVDSRAIFHIDQFGFSIWFYFSRLKPPKLALTSN